jgi:hypothetical protein
MGVLISLLATIPICMCFGTICCGLNKNNTLKVVDCDKIKDE